MLYSRQTIARPALAARTPRSARGRGALRALPTPGADVIAMEDKAAMEEVLERFRAADVDGNGRIDRAELKLLLESVEGGLAYPLLLESGWVPEEKLEETMTKYDTDKSGDIDLEEFKQLVYDGLLLEGTIQDYEDAFNAVDNSGNGSIGATELAQLFKNLGTPMGLDKVAEVFMKYDKDESGQIEFGEFLQMFQDQLLDLKKIQAWLYSQADSVAWDPAGSLLQTVEGDVSVIFGEDELQEALAKAGDKLVVLFCGLTWCRPCKGVARAYEKLAEAYSQTVFLKLYGNANPSCKALFKRLRIRSTPSFIYYRNGAVVGINTGANKQRLEATMREVLQPGERASEPLYPAEAAAAPASA